ncbi:MAG: hypothetical protein EAZ27_07110 [Cytophagales bacterium]|nr:MAG: hypothetical protein EAZ27_07110 [Cytophagales bacterium]
MDEREAKNLVQYIESRVKHKFEHAREVFPGKEDIYRLELKIAESKDSTSKIIARIELKIAESREATSKQIAKSRDSTSKIIAGIELKIAESRDSTNKLIIESREETNKKFAEVNLNIAEYHTKIAESKNDLIKWLFTLILGSTIAAIGVTISILKVR